MVGRKLDNIHQELDLLAKQGKAEGFLNNLKNAEKLRSLVGDVSDAVMDYQVCSQSEPIVLMPDTHFRHHYNKTSINKVVSSL